MMPMKSKLDTQTYPSIQPPSIRAQSDTHHIVVHICSINGFEYGLISAIPTSDIDSWSLTAVLHEVNPVLVRVAKNGLIRLGVEASLSFKLASSLFCIIVCHTLKVKDEQSR